MPAGSSLSGAGKRLAAGRRDLAVDIQFLQAPIDAEGYPVEHWETEASGVMMSRQDYRGDERFMAAQTAAFIETNFEMPYMPCMDPDLVDVQKERRLVVSGRIFDIRSATTIGRRRGIELVTLAGSRLVEDPS